MGGDGWWDHGQGRWVSRTATMDELLVSLATPPPTTVPTTVPRARQPQDAEGTPVEADAR